MRKPFKTYRYTLKCGKPVEIRYYPDYFLPQKENDMRVDHLEFRSPLLTSTGYRSHFITREYYSTIDWKTYAGDMAEGLYRDYQKENKLNIDKNLLSLF
jgi:hypothetical protein